MCDQTELPYSSGDIVWVKLGPVWWPGQVQDYEKLPEEITGNLRKKPIAVVKFFQEESFEYVKNINHIYHYNCRKKHEFIKKGLDLCRSSNSRDVPSNMNLFPNDIATAEHLTGGNPNIIKDDEFAPEEKADYSELFGAKKSPGKKLKADSIKKEYSGWRLKHIKETSLKNGRRSLPSTPPRVITHPRFINKAFHGQSDHEIRIRHQVTTPLREDDPVSSSPQKQYNCHICGFTSTRLNVIILHNKSHSAGFSDTYLATSASQLKRPKLKDYSVPTAVVKSRVKSTPRRLLLGLDTPKRKKERSPKDTKTETLEESPVTSTPKKDKVEEKTPVKKTENVKRKSVKDRKQNSSKKIENEAIRETLLKDWDEDDDIQEEAEIEGIKQINEDKPEEDKEAKVEEEKPEQVKTGQSRLLGKRSIRLGKTLGNKEDATKAKETSCFDFDDSDEGIRLDGTVMKFGMKIPRVLGDDKTKRKSVDVETTEQIGALKDKELKKAEEDKKLKTEFENLLEETAVPVIPDVPKNLPTINAFSNESDSSDVQDIKISNNASTDTDTSKDAAENELIRMEIDNRNSIENSSVNERKDENDDQILETAVESSIMCNITEITSINKDEFDSVVDNELVKVTLKSESDVIDSAKTVETSEFESNLETTTQEQSEFEISQFTSDETVSTKKIEQEENKAEEYVEFKINFEAASDCAGGAYKSTLEVDETVVTKDISMECESQYVHDQGLTQKIEISSDVTIKDEDIGSSTVKVESESSQNETSSKAKMDLEDIVNDIYIEETITATEESESNVEVMSEPVVTETVQNTSPIQTEIEKDKSMLHVVESEKFQDVPFDINAMPVIIGEDFIQPEETKPIILNPSKASTSDDITPQNRNVIMISNQNSSGNEVGSKVLQSVISVAGKEGQIITSKSLANKSLTTVKTIKIPQGSPLNTLKSVPGFSKSGSNQVLILKTAGGQNSKISVNKTNLQKLGTQQIIQQGGGKVLILTNPQSSSQGKITTLTSQQQVLTSGSKLPPGTRLITSKGTVLSTSGAQTVTLGKTMGQKNKTTPKYVISKGNLLTTTSKNMMIGKSGILTPITSTTTKGQTFITQNVVSSKGNLIIPSSSAISKSPTVMTQTITTSKGMILTPMTSKGIIAGNQKVRIVSSTAPMTIPSGARLVVQNPQSKLVTIPQQKNQKLKIVTKGQPSGSTLLIQTSQGHPTLLSSSQITTKPKLIPLSKSLPSISPQIVPRLTVPQTQPQILTKKVAQKVRQASPNILQKSQKKPTPRGQKSYQNRLISPQQTVSSQETILMPTGLPVVDQSIMKTGLPQGEGTALVYLTVDEAGNYRPLSDNSLVSFEGTQHQDSRTLYIDPGTTDMDNIFLTIDDAGNVVNISQPAPPTFTSESSLPSQDILAKALANTQVLQPETILPDSIPSSIVSSSLDHTTLNSSFAEQAHYPAPSLSHSVLETSLTLNQPIMTPLEVPSAVSSSNLNQIASLPSSFIHSNLLNQKTQLIRPSMPLLTEDSDNSPQPEPVYLLDSAHNIIAPVTSGSLSLQLALNDNVIVSSQGGTSVIPSSYQVVSTNVLTSPVFSDPNNFKSENTITSLNDSVQSPFIIQSDQNEIIIPSGYDSQEQSESPHITTDFLNDVESKPDIKQEIVSESIEGHSNAVESNNYLNDEIDKPLLKRSSEEDCDIETESSPKRVKIDER